MTERCRTDVYYETLQRANRRVAYDIYGREIIATSIPVDPGYIPAEIQAKIDCNLCELHCSISEIGVQRYQHYPRFKYADDFGDDDAYVFNCLTDKVRGFLLENCQINKIPNNYF